MTVSAPAVTGINVPERIHPGDRVEVLAGVLHGHTGTVIRASRLLWQKAWLVKLDARRLGSTRITPRVLRLIDVVDDEDA
jgi:hypothetical protein